MYEDNNKTNTNYNRSYEGRAPYSSGGDGRRPYNGGGDRRIPYNGGGDGRRPYNGGDGRGGDRKPQQQSNRPMPVTVPTEVDITANMYKYKGEMLCLYTYTVTITPEVKSIFLFNKFMKIFTHNDRKENVCFDGYSTLVSDTKFEDYNMEFPLKEGVMNCKVEYRNTYKMEDAINSHEDNTGITQCLEIISKHYQRLQYHVDKRRMIDPKSDSIDIGKGLIVMSGLTTTFKFNNDGLFMNLDPSFSVFYKPQPLISLIIDLVQSSYGRRNNSNEKTLDSLTPEMTTTVEKSIKKLKLRTNHRGEKNRSFMCFGLCEETAETKIIEFEDKTSETVAAYFARVYSPLKCPNLPLVIFRVRDKMEIYMPMEVLDIAPMQKYSPRLNEFMTANMIKIASKRPFDRFKLIESKVEELKATSNETLNKFGILFDNKFTNCKGLRIPAPKMLFGQEKTVEVFGGSWNLRGVNAYSPGIIKNWKIFYFKESDKLTSAHINSFTQMADSYGITFPSEAPIQEYIRKVKDYFDADKEFLNLIILPDSASIRYSEIKMISETYDGVFTQCILSRNRAKLTNKSFASNLLMKINTKTGGRNFALANEDKILNDEPTMVFGIDVSHPSVSDIDSPTITAVVGSMDYDFINYTTRIDEQEAKQEMVKSLGDSVVSMLKAHYTETGTKPSRLIFFRAGIAESNFISTFNSECAAIKDACLKLEPGYSPKINYIITQKRHSVRFGTEQGRDNLAPGTFISSNTSTGTTGDDADLDFFLVSANALQGTARPTRYKIFYNESNLTKDVLYKAIYYMCHLFERATKSVSVVPPIYYADLACGRGRACLVKKSTSTSENTTENVEDDGKLVLRKVKSEIAKTLYYV